MAVDPRIRDLLARWPDDLSDSELGELRAAAEANPTVDELLAALVEAEALLTGAPATPELSDGGADRLQSMVDEAKAWSTGGATPSGNADVVEIKGWSTGGATPSGKAEVEEATGWSTGGATPSGKVVDFGEARRRRGLLSSPALIALAAAILIAGAMMLRDRLAPEQAEWREDDRYGFKDDDTTDRPRIDGQLWVMGETRVQDGDARRADAPVTFRAVLERDAALVLLETQGEKTWVVHPAPGDAWVVPAGTHLLQPPGSSPEYTPGSAGPATYTLVASQPDDPITVPDGRFVPSVEALIDRPGATYALESVKIVWEEVD